MPARHLAEDMAQHASIASVVIPVYRDGKRAISATHRLLAQQLPGGTELEIILVDDGSGDGTAGLLSQITDQRVQVLTLEHNQGRSAARNAGARQARGTIVVFMDCDCEPVGDGFLAVHLSMFEHGHVASTGHVIGTGDGFWSRYQSEASSRRARQHAHGDSWSGSSQNLAVLKSAFDQAGGFDTQYRHYGFEDRDLLLRLSRFGAVAWAGGAGVRHLDTLVLEDVSRKMIEAGEYNARLFSTRYPAAYRALGYASIDVRLRPWLRVIGKRFGPSMPGIASHAEPLLHHRWVPYLLAKAMVKWVSAMSFLYGTMRAG